MRDDEQAPSPHKRGIFETRELCRDLFYQLPSGLDNDSSVNPPTSQLMLTRALLEYHSDIAVKRKSLQSIWETGEPLDVVKTLPPVSTVTIPIEHVDPAGGVDDGFEPLSRVQLDDKEVRLSSLQEAWGIQNQATVKIYRATDRNEPVATRQYTLALPPRSARLVKSALDDCLEELGWTEDATEKDEHAAPI